MTTPIAFDLFAGSGGLALGLEFSGFSTRALVEQDRYCCATLRTNASRYFPLASVLRRDIRRLSIPEVLRRTGLRKSDIALVSGGPPCQSFSIAGIPKGGMLIEDPRDLLLMHFLRFVKMIRPKVFLFENVPGLLSKSQGYLFARFLRALQKLGYVTTQDVLNSANYGVPQARRRLFLLGSLADKIELPQPSHGCPGNADHLPTHISIGEVLSKLQLDLPNQNMPRTSNRRRLLLENMVPGSQWKHWRHRDRWTLPSRCITAHCRYDWVHPLEPRPGTVRELASLQTFPDDYVFCGPHEASHDSNIGFQYRQVGNSVPVLMAKAIGAVLKRHLADTK